MGLHQKWFGPPIWVVTQLEILLVPHDSTRSNTCLPLPPGRWSSVCVYTLF